jgi:endogenous inhibitor of DNA gyrase (YacG/DUF329 family)
MSGSEATKPCPICGKPAAPRCRPFCSRRCADIDLGRWFTEGYAVPEQPSDTKQSADDEEG